MTKVIDSHSRIKIECDDGKMREMLTCRVSPDDITENGTVEWPPSGECTCRDMYDYDKGMAVNPSIGVKNDIDLEEYQRLIELEERFEESLENMREITRKNYY